MPISLGIGVRPTQLGSVFSPLSLAPFLWLDPSDLTTLFQDSAGTTPVTANNDPVGRINDKSGNGRHLTQATAAARPLYKTAGGLHWLESDGTNDFLSVAHSAIAQPLDRVSAWRRLDAVLTVDRQLCGGNGAGVLFLRNVSTSLSIFSGGLVIGPAAPANGADFVAAERHNGASSRVAIDNDAYSTGDAGLATATATAICANGGIPGNFATCRFYGLAQFDRALTDPEIAQLRTYLAAKQGRAL